jgi:chromosome condensin MukBEF ATPase and DNA-binding subunit MukB
MSIEQKITVRAMERALKAKTQDEVSKAAIWANNQLSLVSLWQRTGVKPAELEF